MADKTYLIERPGEKLQITIPDDWKVTYGPVSPGSKGYGNDLALRIYESDTKQRAIFTNVQSFRDMSIPVKRAKVTTTGTSTWEDDVDGYSSSTKVSHEEKWTDET